MYIKTPLSRIFFSFCSTNKPNKGLQKSTIYTLCVRLSKFDIDPIENYSQ